MELIFSVCFLFRAGETLKLKTEAPAGTENPKEIRKRAEKEKRRGINRRIMKRGTKNMKETPRRNEKNKRGKEAKAERPSKEEKQKKLKEKETQSEEMISGMIKDRKERKDMKEEEKRTD